MACGRSEPGGRFLYILKDAVSEYSGQPEAGKQGKKPVPPCIVQVSPEAVQVTLEVRSTVSAARL